MDYKKDEDAIIIKPPSRHDSSVIWLHGLGADGHDFEPVIPELGLPVDHGIQFIFPNAPVRPVTINGGMAMRAWYDVRAVDLSREEDEEAIHESGKLLHDYISSEMESGIPSDRILIAGFSQGGAITLFGGMRFPHKLAGILALSCYLPLPEQIIPAEKSAQGDIPVMMMHGTFDPVIPVSQGQASRDLLRQSGYSVGWQEYTMQHGVCPRQIIDIGDWLHEVLLN